jgi:Kae1-associated kinase Bud32
LASKENKWGAEAILQRDVWLEYQVLKKIRIPKSYRIEQIDNELRRTRTVSESKLLIASRDAGVKTPFIFDIDLEEAIIVMEHIEGQLVKDLLNSSVSLDNKLNYISLMGREVGKLHTNDIIHGDLTTSNVLIKNQELVFIDFGLGKFSKAVEDKAVDILLIKKCFTSTHTNYEKEYFEAFQKGYKETMEEAKTVFRRALKVEARARHLKEDQTAKDYLL